MFVYATVDRSTRWQPNTAGTAVDTMTNEKVSPETNEGSNRRTFLKKGSLATAGTGMVLSATGLGAAQEQEEDDDDVFVNEEESTCIMFQNDFRPESQFVITSPVLDWSPDVPQNLGSTFEEYNTRMIRYRNTGDNVLFFQSQDATVPDFDQEVGYVVDNDETFDENEFTQPEVFSLWNEASFYEGTTRLVTAKFSPVEEDVENGIWEEEGATNNEEDDWIF